MLCVAAGAMALESDHADEGGRHPPVVKQREVFAERTAKHAVRCSTVRDSSRSPKDTCKPRMKLVCHRHDTRLAISGQYQGVPSWPRYGEFSHENDLPFESRMVAIHAHKRIIRLC